MLAREVQLLLLYLKPVNFLNTYFKDENNETFKLKYLLKILRQQE